MKQPQYLKDGTLEVLNMRTTIATLTAQLVEARAMAGAVIERAAQVAEDWWYDPAKDEVTDTVLATEIRALDPDASAALAEYVRPFKERAEKAEAERQLLAEAICGGEDFPGILASVQVDYFVDFAREQHRYHHADIDAKLAAEAEVTRLRDGLIDSTASLVAAVSLLKRGGKKAAPSDNMFAQMLIDYDASINRARALLEGAKP